MALTKVPDVDLLGRQNVASNTTVVGSSVDVADVYAAVVMIRFGRAVATALSNPATIRIEALFATSGNDHWVTVAKRVSTVSAVHAPTISSGGGAGSSVVTLSAGTGFAVGQLILFRNGTGANSEWHHIKAITGAQITLEMPLANDQTTATVTWGAEEWAIPLEEIIALSDIRAVADCSGTGQAVTLEARLSKVTAL